MTSILKVDQLQDSGGNAIITSDGAGSITTPGITTGKVLQVVNGTVSGTVISNSSTPSDTGLTASITPSSTSSKVLIIVHQNGLGKESNSTFGSLFLQKNGSDLIRLEGAYGYTASTQQNYIGGAGCAYLDSPATTSSITYKTQFYSTNNTGDVLVNTNSATSTICLMEIGA
jgi:hypothetical protein